MAIEMISKEWCPCVEDSRKEFLVDTEADVNSLPKCCTGSTALVTATGNVYIVNASGRWVAFGSEG